MSERQRANRGAERAWSRMPARGEASTGTSEVIGADPETLRDLLPKVSALGDQVSDILAALSAALEAEGACWGRDEAGTAFAASYLPASGAARSLIALVATGIQDTTTILSAVRTVFKAGERDAAAAVGG